MAKSEASKPLPEATFQVLQGEHPATAVAEPTAAYTTHRATETEDKESDSSEVVSDTKVQLEQVRDLENQLLAICPQDRLAHATASLLPEANLQSKDEAYEASFSDARTSVGFVGTHGNQQRQFLQDEPPRQPNALTPCTLFLSSSDGGSRCSDPLPT